MASNRRYSTGTIEGPPLCCKVGISPKILQHAHRVQLSYKRVSVTEIYINQ